jgi:hypothetical protein
MCTYLTPESQGYQVLVSAPNDQEESYVVLASSELDAVFQAGAQHLQRHGYSAAGWTVKAVRSESEAAGA